jgi:hypothetical protein
MVATGKSDPRLGPRVVSLRGAAPLIIRKAAVELSPVGIGSWGVPLLCTPLLRLCVLPAMPCPATAGTAYCHVPPAVVCAAGSGSGC